MGDGLGVMVNGKEHPYTPGTTLELLLTSLLNGPATVVAEVNGEIVPREAFGKTFLNAGDRVEIVHFVGGG